jgi:hypothetical protein
MSAAWMLYAVAVGLVVTVAALAAEQGTRLARRAGRWIWMLAAIVTVAWPLLAPHNATEPVPVPGTTTPTVATLVLGGLPATPAAIRPAWPLRTVQAVQADRAAFDIDRLARWGWGMSSALALAVFAGAGVVLRRRQRAFMPGAVAGVSVLVSHDAGPAVVGLLHTRIVVPIWLLNVPHRQQLLIMAHEQAHIDAGDQRLLAAMVLLAVIMPWNIPLWFQLRRLRLAIEVDCDARVLAQGYGVAEYGAALIDAGRASSRLAFMTPAVSASAGFLERRLRLMLRRPARWHRIVAPVLLLLALDIGGVAARIAPPQAPAVRPVPLAQRQPLAGYYQLGANRVAIVGVTTNGLEMKTNAEPSWRLLPESADDYAVPGTGLRVHFDRAMDTMTLRAAGVDTLPAPRVDATAVERADAYVAARIASGQPLPDGHDIVLRNVGASAVAQLHAADFAPGFLQQVITVMPRQRALNAAYGKVEDVAFAGVNRWGWDRYTVRYANRTVTWAIWLDDAGKLAAATQDGTP